MPPPRGHPNILEGPGDYDVTSQVHSDVYPAISPAQFDMAGKAVLVTGGSRGIGKAITLAYVRAGASHVAVLSTRGAPAGFEQEVQDAAQNAKRAAPKVLSVAANLSDQASVEKAAKSVQDAFGKLDVVINNAGVLNGRGLIADTTPDDWFANFEVNVKGAYLIARAFVPLLLKSSAPHTYIVQIASVGAHLIGPSMSGYQVSKTAQLRLSQFIDAEYREKGVVSFAIHPGNIPTDMTNGTIQANEAFKEIFVDSPELPGETLVYLTAADRAWLGGRYINATWDMPELMAKEAEIVKSDQLKTKFNY